MTKLKITFLN